MLLVLPDGTLFSVPAAWMDLEAPVPTSAYAGGYLYGNSQQERYIDESGRLPKRVRRLPRSQWTVVIQDHQAGFIGGATFNHYENE